MYHGQVGATLSRMRKIAGVVVAAMLAAGCSSGLSADDKRENFETVAAGLGWDVVKATAAAKAACGLDDLAARMMTTDMTPAERAQGGAIIEWGVPAFCPEQAARWVRLGFNVKV